MGFLFGIILGVLGAFIIKVSFRFIVIAAAIAAIAMVDMRWVSWHNLTALFGSSLVDPLESLSKKVDLNKVKDAIGFLDRKPRGNQNRQIEGQSSGKIILESNYNEPMQFTGPINLISCNFTEGLTLQGVSRLRLCDVAKGISASGELSLQHVSADQVRFSGKARIRKCVIDNIIIDGENSELDIENVAISGNIICRHPDAKVHTNTPELLAKVIRQ